jgi:copper(I)-binding protein
MLTTLHRAALAAILGLSALPAFAQGIQVHDAYAIQAVPGAPTAAAFMDIHNHSREDDHLLSARSDIAERTELHTHTQSADGVMQMSELTDGLAFPSGALIPFERGGYHVMFLGVSEPLTDGQVFPITLVFENAGEVVVEVTVDNARIATDAMDHGTMDHGEMDHGEMDHDMDHDAMHDEAAPASE